MRGKTLAFVFYTNLWQYSYKWVNWETGKDENILFILLSIIAAVVYVLYSLDIWGEE